MKGIDPKQESEKYQGWERIRKRNGRRHEGLNTKVSEHVNSIINAPYAP
jgi:hypothetical protein